jgi:hypothetical protein
LVEGLEKQQATSVFATLQGSVADYCIIAAGGPTGENQLFVFGIGSNNARLQNLYHS